MNQPDESRIAELAVKTVAHQLTSDEQAEIDAILTGGRAGKIEFERLLAEENTIIILDMGCGWGTSSEIMAFAGLTVTGLDINPRFVELVNSRSKRIGHNVDAVQGRFDLIPGEALYDAALFYEFLHHAIRPWEVLDLVRSRLKIGGKLLLAGEPINNIWKHWGIRTDPLSLYCIRKYGWFESGWSADFLKECVERSQFKIEHFAEEPNGIGWTLVAQAAS